jgi:hypothetical protein
LNLTADGNYSVATNRSKRDRFSEPIGTHGDAAFAQTSAKDAPSRVDKRVREGGLHAD